MADKLINKLIEVLNQEYEYYRELKQLAADKKEIIITNDIEQLSDIIAEDEEIVNHLEQLEQTREQLLAELAINYELNGEQINFRDLQEHLTSDKQQQLVHVRQRLLSVIEELDQQNEQNRQLLEEAIKINDFSFKMMARILEPETQTYNNRSHNKNKEPDKTNHIINRQA